MSSLPHEDCLQILNINFCITECCKNSSLRLLNHRFKDSTKMWRSKLIPFPTHSLIGGHPLYFVLVHSRDQALQFPRCAYKLRSAIDPLRAVILTKASTNASMSKDDTISKWHKGSSNREKTQITLS